MILFIYDTGQFIPIDDGLPIIVYDFILAKHRPTSDDVYVLSKEEYDTVLEMIDTYK